MAVIVKQLKEKGTGTPFVPVTHWDAVVGKPEQTIEKVTYSQLVNKRDNSQLTPGQEYRITDYVATTTLVGTDSAGHQFDIIVTADSENTVNETARAILHDGDTYFANCNLNAWILSYSLDNDTSRFEWADEENGKGVIYYFKDENDIISTYDFKNIRTNFRRLTTAVHSNIATFISNLPSSVTDRYYYMFDQNGTDFSLIFSNYVAHIEVYGPKPYSGGPMELPLLSWTQKCRVWDVHIHISRVNVITSYSRSCELHCAHYNIFDELESFNVYYGCSWNVIRHWLDHSQALAFSNNVSGGHLLNVMMTEMTNCHYGNIRNSILNHVIYCNFYTGATGTTYGGYYEGVNISSLEYVNIRNTATTADNSRSRNIIFQPGLNGTSSVYSNVTISEAAQTFTTILDKVNSKTIYVS